jgi:hypothetical protein
MPWGEEDKKRKLDKLKKVVREYRAEYIKGRLGGSGMQPILKDLFALIDALERELEERKSWLE